MSAHPSAIIDPAAQIGSNVTIGPFCVIGPNTVIGDNCVIKERASIDWTRLGANSHVGANSIVGGDPQIYNWTKIPSWVEVGEGVFINELTAIHRSMYENGATVIGAGSYVMTQVHIGHDCKLGRETTITTLAGLSGHVEVGDYANVGGAAGIHQFVRIGAMAMVGGMSRIVQDVPPYFTVMGVPAEAHGLNLYQLKKRSMPPQDRANLRIAYHILTERPRLPIQDALEKISAEMKIEGPVAELVEFVKTSKRGITL